MHGSGKVKKHIIVYEEKSRLLMCTQKLWDPENLAPKKSNQPGMLTNATTKNFCDRGIVRYLWVLWFVCPSAVRKLYSASVIWERLTPDLNMEESGKLWNVFVLCLSNIQYLSHLISSFSIWVLISPVMHCCKGVNLYLSYSSITSSKPGVCCKKYSYQQEKSLICTLYQYLW